MKPLDSQKSYQEYVDQKSPNSPIIKNCFNAFWVGGLICSIGQIIMDICKQNGLDTQLSGTVVSIILPSNRTLILSWLSAGCSLTRALLPPKSMSCATNTACTRSAVVAFVLQR